MYSIPIERIYEKIHAKTQMPVSEIKEKVHAKLNQLSGLISEEGAAHIIANELGVKLFEAPGLTKISDISAGMRGFDLQGKVLKKYPVREFSTRDGRAGKVGNMLIADESGATRAVFWNSQVDVFDKINENDTLRIGNVTVKDNNGRPEAHLNDSSTVMVNPPGLSISVSVARQAPQTVTRKYIQDLNENDTSVSLIGAIVQVFDIKFFEVCPACQKRAKNTEEGFFCPTHSKVIPNINYVLSFILDDGTGTMRVVCWREQTQQLTQKTHEELLMYKEAVTGFEDAKLALLGNLVKCTGRIQKNATFDRMEFVASAIDTKPNPEQELQVLMDSHLSPKAPTPDLDANRFRQAPNPKPQETAPSVKVEETTGQSFSEELFEDDG